MSLTDLERELSGAAEDTGDYSGGYNSGGLTTLEQELAAGYTPDTTAAPSTAYDPWAAYDNDTAEEAPGDIWGGAEGGWEETKGLIKGLGAMGASALGFDETAEEWMGYAQEDFDEAQSIYDTIEGDGPQVWKDVHDTGGFIDYVQFQFGRQLPNLVGGLGIGSLVGTGTKMAVSGSIKAAVKGSIKKRIASERIGGVVTAEVADKAAEIAIRNSLGTSIGKEIATETAKGVSKAVGRGQAAGVYATSVGLVTGETGIGIYEDTGKMAPGASLAAGLIGGALDTALPLAILRKAGLPTVAGRKIYMRALGAMAMIGGEATTETAQEAIMMAAESWVNENETFVDKLLSPEGKERLTESFFAAGAGVTPTAIAANLRSNIPPEDGGDDAAGPAGGTPVIPDDVVDEAATAATQVQETAGVIVEATKLGKDSEVAAVLEGFENEYGEAERIKLEEVVARKTKEAAAAEQDEIRNPTIVPEEDGDGTAGPELTPEGAPVTRETRQAAKVQETLDANLMPDGTERDISELGDSPAPWKVTRLIKKQQTAEKKALKPHFDEDGQTQVEEFNADPANLVKLTASDFKDDVGAITPERIAEQGAAKKQAVVDSREKAAKKHAQKVFGKDFDTEWENLPVGGGHTRTLSGVKARYAELNPKIAKERVIVDPAIKTARDEERKANKIANEWTRRIPKIEGFRNVGKKWAAKMKAAAAKGISFAEFEKNTLADNNSNYTNLYNFVRGEENLTRKPSTTETKLAAAKMERTAAVRAAQRDSEKNKGKPTVEDFTSDDKTDKTPKDSVPTKKTVKKQTDKNKETDTTTSKSPKKTKSTPTTPTPDKPAKPQTKDKAGKNHSSILGWFEIYDDIFAGTSKADPDVAIQNIADGIGTLTHPEFKGKRVKHEAKYKKIAAKHPKSKKVPVKKVVKKAASKKVPAKKAASKKVPAKKAPVVKKPKKQTKAVAKKLLRDAKKFLVIAQESVDGTTMADPELALGELRDALRVITHEHLEADVAEISRKADALELQADVQRPQTAAEGKVEIELAEGWYKNAWDLVADMKRGDDMPEALVRARDALELVTHPRYDDRATTLRAQIVALENQLKGEKAKAQAAANATTPGPDRRIEASVGQANHLLTQLVKNNYATSYFHKFLNNKFGTKEGKKYINGVVQSIKEVIEDETLTMKQRLEKAQEIIIAISGSIPVVDPNTTTKMSDTDAINMGLDDSKKLGGLDTSGFESDADPLITVDDPAMQAVDNAIVDAIDGAYGTSGYRKSGIPLHRLLDIIIDNAPSDNPMYHAARLLRTKHSGSMTVSIETNEDIAYEMGKNGSVYEQSGYQGVYFGGLSNVKGREKIVDKILINRDVVEDMRDTGSGLITQVVLHEATHGYTVARYYLDPTFRLKVDTLYKQAKRQAETDGINTDYETGGQYGWLNSREFLAEALTSANFQAMLKSIAVVKTNAWDRFIAIIAKMLNGYKGATENQAASTVKFLHSKHFGTFLEDNANLAEAISDANTEAQALLKDGIMSGPERQRLVKKFMHDRIGQPYYTNAAQTLSGRKQGSGLTRLEIKTRSRANSGILNYGTLEAQTEYQFGALRQRKRETKAAEKASVHPKEVASILRARNIIGNLVGPEVGDSPSMAAVGGRVQAGIMGTDMDPTSVAKTGSKLVNGVKAVGLGLTTLVDIKLMFRNLFQTTNGNLLDNMVRALQHHAGRVNELRADLQDELLLAIKNTGISKKETRALGVFMEKVTRAGFDPRKATDANAKTAKQRAEHGKLRTEWEALSPNQKKSFNIAHGFYVKYGNRIFTATAAHLISAHNLPLRVALVFKSGNLSAIKKVTHSDDDLSSELFEEIKKQMVGAAKLKEGNRTGIYFPLKRFGKYFMSVTEVITHTTKYADKKDARAAAADMMTDDPGSTFKYEKTSDNQFTIKQTVKAYERYDSEAESEAARIAQGPNTAVRTAHAGLARDSFLGDAGTAQNVLAAALSAGRRKLEKANKGVQNAQSDADRLHFIKQAEAAKHAMSAVNEMLIGALPESNIARTMIHRTNQAGASTDFLKAGAAYINSLSYGISHLEKGHDVTTAMNELAAHSNAQGNNTKTERVVQELYKRRTSGMMASDTAKNLASGASKIAVIWHLITVSFVVMQLVQPLMTTMPFLIQRHGFKKGTAALAKAWGSVSGPLVATALAGKTWKDAAGGQGFKGIENALIGSLSKNNPEHAELMKAMIKEGAMDASATMNILAHASKGDSRPGEVVDMIMDVGRVLPHAAEYLNRSSAAIAAYDLAKEANPNLSKKELYEIAAESIRRTQFDYTDMNRPRYFNAHPLLQVATMFKMFPLGIYSLMISQWMGPGGALDKAAPLKTRANAAKSIMTMAVVHMGMAGAAGGLFIEPVRMLAEILAAFFDDDDPEEQAIIQALKNPDFWLADFLEEHIGMTAAEAAAWGLPRLIGTDMSSRVGLNNLFLMVTRGDNALDTIAKTAGNTILGPVFGKGQNVSKFANYVGEGNDWIDGVRKYLIPKLPRDIWNAVEYKANGMKDFNGNQMLKPEDFTYGEMIQKAVIGFTPATEANLWELINNKNDRIRGITGAADGLKRAFRDAETSADRASVRNQVLKFNRSLPTEFREYRLTHAALLRGIKTRAKREHDTRNGIYVNRKERAFVRTQPKLIGD